MKEIGRELKLCWWRERSDLSSGSKVEVVGRARGESAMEGISGTTAAISGGGSYGG
ncbi:hypothetical protein COLO4_08916 [Corchorus olitorius]|uniref:Uncharacterized protein n=1 Tax=Corchorus olitorius TaxID=93759 RepID=A0A1R3KE60_9ROSI|nr:hypothetical protein COLO4_08916 [Corchorus olitorius]